MNANALSTFKINSDSHSKELLISLPYLSDKNATVINNGLKQLQGIISIEVCYELKLMIVTFDREIQNEENILNNIKSQEINSSIDQLKSDDINKIRMNYKIDSIK